MKHQTPLELVPQHEKHQSNAGAVIGFATRLVAGPVGAIASAISGYGTATVIESFIDNNSKKEEDSKEKKENKKEEQDKKEESEDGILEKVGEKIGDFFSHFGMTVLDEDNPL